MGFFWICANLSNLTQPARGILNFHTRKISIIIKGKIPVLCPNGHFLCFPGTKKPRLPQISNATKKPPPFAQRMHRFRKGKAWLENAAQPRQPLGGNVPKRGDPRGIVCSVLGLTDWLHKVIHPAPGLRFPDAKEGASDKKINDGRALTLVRVTWRYNGRPATHYWPAYLCDSFIIHRSIQILKCLWQW